MKYIYIILFVLVLSGCTASKVNKPKCYIENSTVVLYITEEEIENFKYMELECSNF